MEQNLIRFEWLPENVVIGLTGIQLSGDIPYEQWERLMSTVSHMEMAAQWAIGDALNYGASRYGEKYSQAIEVTGHSYQALANYSWVARNVPPDVRRPGLFNMIAQAAWRCRISNIIQVVQGNGLCFQPPQLRHRSSVCSDNIAHELCV